VVVGREAHSNADDAFVGHLAVLHVCEIDSIVFHPDCELFCCDHSGHKLATIFIFYFVLFADDAFMLLVIRVPVQSALFAILIAGFIFILKTRSFVDQFIRSHIFQDWSGMFQ
jgi:hypothetical protein